jgi:arylsulfatase A-like enzyme
MKRLLFALLLGLSITTYAADPKRPNVVIILADDQGWGDLSVNGNTDDSTPRIDSLSKDGAMFDRFFVCPVCAPTRSEFMTGRFFARTGVHGVSTGEERLNLDEVTIAQAFKAGGYATGCFGKWHNGSQAPYHPNSRGFEEFYGFTSGHWGSYFNALIDHNGNFTTGKGFIVDDLTEHAMEFIEQHKDGNFFCYLPVNIPHSPMQVPDKFYTKFTNAEIKQRSSQPAQEDIAHTRAALAMTENLDWNVGRVLDKLKELKLEENTIVIYFSDNGPNGWRYNGGMKGRKGSTDEGGVRVPFMIRWPGHINAGARVPQIAGAIDLFPTLCDLTGVPVPKTKPMDGKSLKPLLLTNIPASVSWPDREFISFQAGGKKSAISVRSQQYRLDQAGALFDMVADPNQKQDVAAQHPDEVTRLKAIAKKFSADVAPVLAAAKDRPYPVGYAPVTYLPARDGEGHGNVKRSGRAPNCTYFTNWTSTDDSITWDIEPGTPGEYEATLYYTCAPENVGAEIEMSFAGKTLRATVNEAYDPPAYGMENDRAPRDSESYVKDFKPLKIGAIELAKTRAPLTLRALKIPGKAAIEVRFVIFEKKRQ